MQTLPWLQACYDTLYLDARPTLFECPGGFGPFARRGSLLPTLFLAGAEELAEPIEPLVSDEAAAAALSELVLDSRLPVRFGHLPADGPFATTFLRLAERRGIVVSAPVAGSPVLELDQSWTDPLSRFSSRRRSDFRRMHRRAEAEGKLRYEFLEPDAADVANLLQKATAVEARSWKGRANTAIAQNPAQSAFLNRFGVLAAAEGGFRVAFLYIGDQPAAMQIALVWKGAYWLLKIGYDERFSRASPGLLLLLESIRHAAANGLERVEFLGKASHWTTFWTDKERPNMSLRYYPRSPLGLAALVRDGAGVAKNRAAISVRKLRTGGRA